MVDDEITVSVYVGKKTCVSAIHSLTHRDSQNMQDSYLNRLLWLNIYRYTSPYRDLI